jgi:hypothetical protein
MADSRRTAPENLSSAGTAQTSWAITFSEGAMTSHESTAVCHPARRVSPLSHGWARQRRVARPEQDVKGVARASGRRGGQDRRPAAGPFSGLRHEDSGVLPQSHPPPAPSTQLPLKLRAAIVYPRRKADGWHALASSVGMLTLTREHATHCVSLIRVTRWLLPTAPPPSPSLGYPP